MLRDSRAYMWEVATSRVNLCTLCSTRFSMAQSRSTVNPISDTMGIIGETRRLRLTPAATVTDAHFVILGVYVT